MVIESPDFQPVSSYGPEQASPWPGVPKSSPARSTRSLFQTMPASPARALVNSASGCLKRTVISSAPVFVMAETLVNSSLCSMSGSACRFRLHRTSSAVSFEPSWKVTPERTFRTRVLSSGVVAFSARNGLTVMSGWSW